MNFWKGLKMAGFDGIVGNVAGRAVNQVSQQVVRTGVGAVTKGISGLFGTVASAVGGAVSGAQQAYKLSDLPDKIDLSKSPTMSGYVDKALMLINGGRGNFDGQIGKQELDQINRLRQANGVKEPLTNQADFTKDDLGRVMDAMEKRVDAGRNSRINNPLTNQTSTHIDALGTAIEGAKNELPQMAAAAPEVKRETAPPPSSPFPNFGGG